MKTNQYFMKTFPGSMGGVRGAGLLSAAGRGGLRAASSLKEPDSSSAGVILPPPFPLTPLHLPTGHTLQVRGARAYLPYPRQERGREGMLSQLHSRGPSGPAVRPVWTPRGQGSWVTETQTADRNPGELARRWPALYQLLRNVPEPPPPPGSSPGPTGTGAKLAPAPAAP